MGCAMSSAHATSYVVLEPYVAASYVRNTPSPVSFTVPSIADPLRQCHVWFAAIVALSVWPCR